MTASDGKGKRTEQALSHLRRVKPMDGWSVDNYVSSSGKTLVRLRRRNIPLLEDVGFEELFHDQSGSIFGVLSYIETSSSDSSAHVRAMELVDRNGMLIRNPQKSILRINLTPPGSQSSYDAPSRQQTNNHPTLDSKSQSITKLEVTDEEYKQLLRYGLIGMGSLLILKVFLSNSLVYFLILPLVILYAIQTCPSAETFDAKKELKRVLRGKYLPDDQQPKDWLSKTMVRVQATIGTELATGLGGYESNYISIMGICVIAMLQVPLLNTEYLWIGIFGKWMYILQREKPKSSMDSTKH